MLPITYPKPLGSNSPPYPGLPNLSQEEPQQFLATPLEPAAAPTPVAPNQLW